MRDLGSLLRRRHANDSRPDPAAILDLRLRLGRLAREINRLENDAEFANGFHLRAAVMAYDRTLLESCEIIGAPVPEDGETISRRMIAEATLVSAGWMW